MAGNGVDVSRHDRVHMYIPGEVYAELQAKCATGQSVDDLVEEILGDEKKWAEFQPKLEVRISGSALGGVRHVTTIQCRCCEPRRCRCPFMWRGSARCGCTPDRIAFINAGGKIDLE